MRFETKAIHAGEEPDTKMGTGDVVIPIHLSSTFARSQIDVPTRGYEYSRTKNPTRDALEQKLASIENANYGLAFASGMAAETTLILALLKSGDHILAFDDLYGGTKRLFNRVLSEKFNIHIDYIDARNINEVKDNIKRHTRMIWLESPTNPLLRICDIQKIAEIAKDINENLIVVVDNTFMSPFFQKSLTLGADIVLYSTTKYLNGHSDSIGGAIMLNDIHFYDLLQFTQNATGAILSPFDSYLVARGIKTLPVRMKQHQENALAISYFLEKHPKVSKVIYPGLQSHPEHDLAKRQMSGFGGMLSFEVKGNLENAKQLVESLEYFSIAESLGGVESLIEIPALMTHASVCASDREKIGLRDTLIRVSVGIENVDDLIHDLEHGLDLI